MTDTDPLAGRPVAVIGAGTMGAGIAQVAAAAGHEVLLYDVDPDAAERAVAGIERALDRLVERGRLRPEGRAAILTRIDPVGALDDVATAGLVVEVVVERLDVKRSLFGRLEGIVDDSAILATNTSSLSITDIASGLAHPGRVVGMHFFNPAPILPLVEVVSGADTDPRVADQVFDLAVAWGKSPVRATSTPGFIVNRVARPFYGEAFRAYELGLADPATIDALLREGGGFRMGAFELTDLIGQDVNAAVSASVWEAFGRDPRFTPSAAQAALVEAGRLGRKTGRGWYAYDRGADDRPQPATEAARPAPAAAVDGLRDGELSIIKLPSGGQLRRTEGRSAGETARRTNDHVVLMDLLGDPATATRVAITASPDPPPAALDEAIGLLQAAGLAVSVVADVPGLVVARTIAMLTNVAADAVEAGVATPGDVDLAMKAGVNYPFGPLEWADRIGPAYLVSVLDALAEHDPERYRVSPSLRARAEGAPE